MASNKLPNSEVYRIIESSDKKDATSLQVEVMSELSELLHNYRKKNNITNKQLANRCGISTSIMSRAESGYQNITIETLCRVLSEIGGTIHFEIKE